MLLILEVGLLMGSAYTTCVKCKRFHSHPNKRMYNIANILTPYNIPRSSLTPYRIVTRTRTKTLVTQRLEKLHSSTNFSNPFFPGSKLQKRSSMRTCKVLLQLKLQRPMPAVPPTLNARPDLSQRSVRPSTLRTPNRPGNRIRELHIGQVPARAGPGPERKGTKGLARPLHEFLGIILGNDPALGFVGVGIWVEIFVVMNGIGVDAYVDAWRKEGVVDADAGGADFAPEGATDWWGEAEGFVDAGAEVAAGGEFGSALDFAGGCECGEDFVCELGVAGWVGGEVEEKGREGCGGCVGSFCFWQCVSSFRSEKLSRGG